MSDEKNWDLSKPADTLCKILAVCKECRHHERNPTIEFNFGDSKVYWLCPACQNMNSMDFSKQQPAPYPKPRRI